MTTIAVRQTVADFDTWKDAFDGHADVRRLHGAVSHRVLRDGNAVTVLLDFSDLTSAQGFAADPSLKAAMEKGGVQGAPEITWCADVEQVRY